VNLSGIDHNDISRGMVLTAADVLVPTQILDAQVEVLPGAARPLRSRQRIRFHIGTIEALARVQVLNEAGEIAPGKKDLVQIRLEIPVVAVPGERAIIRRYSPQATIAGGVVIDTFAVRHRRKDIVKVHGFLAAMLTALGDHRQMIRNLVRWAAAAGLSVADLQQRTGLKNELITSAVHDLIAEKAIIEAGHRYVTREDFERLSASTLDAITELHRRDPIAKGITREALSAAVFKHLPPDIFTAVLASLAASGKVIADRDTIKLTSHNTELSPAETALSGKILNLYKNAGLEVPKLDEALSEAVSGSASKPQDARRLFQLFLDSGEIVKVTDEFYFSLAAIDELTGKLKRFADTTADRLIDVPTFKDLAGISRKYAIPLLEYLDRERITRRAGDKRLILSRP
jgi:selenocysteine-specific elongation factor